MHAYLAAQAIECVGEQQRRGGRSWIDGEQGDTQLVHRRVGEARRSCGKLADEPQAGGAAPGQTQDAEAPHLDQTFEASGGRRAAVLDVDTVVADKQEAAINQPQEKIRLAAAARSEQQHGIVVEGGATGVKLCSHAPRIRQSAAVLRIDMLDAILLKRRVRGPALKQKIENRRNMTQLCAQTPKGPPCY